ncbi:hypothetical protein THERMOS_1855 [Bathymodiolus thermophilus thioautotrophic gill symbiont]|uniref:Uncharacterized protein n=1 Tax=Bathymodiolus thermophilus thioautotrophic gill symbiont TaxID=2360 RepID=A0A8H9CHF5_9GAMM|nr:hypothetical protein THERMOS_1855 [Bathymodiolus thermophilus thioautotrophic gill symbiont]
MQFLSRLCGGECTTRNERVATNFLSRLCGGEYPERQVAMLDEISKPPVWR